jgi:hypothetical protein
VTLEAWLDRHTAAAPPVLRTRVIEHALAVDDGPIPVRLAAAGHAALARVLDHAGDRSVALDLLAADALITLALLAQAESTPDRLSAFAASLLPGERPAT